MIRTSKTHPDVVESAAKLKNDLKKGTVDCWELPSVHSQQVFCGYKGSTNFDE